MKRIMVIGGAGYVGSHTCKKLAQFGYEPVVYDNLSTGHKSFVKWGDFIQGDVLDSSLLLASLLKYKIEAILHFAAYSCVGESVLDPEKYYKNNVQGLISILEAMRKADIQNIVVSSTCAVYAQLDKMPISENAPLGPVNPYGASKYFMERILEDYALAYKLNYSALRYFNAAGADFDLEIGERHQPESHLIPLAIKACESRQEDFRLKVFGQDYPSADGTCLRDYIHVNDLASAHVLALEKIEQKKTNLILNLGMGKAFSVLEIIKAVEEVSSSKVKYDFAPRRVGDLACLLADNQKAYQELNWQAKYQDIVEIVASAWQWHKNKPI